MEEVSAVARNINFAFFIKGPPLGLPNYNTKDFAKTGHPCPASLDDRAEVLYSIPQPFF